MTTLETPMTAVEDSPRDISSARSTADRVYRGVAVGGGALVLVLMTGIAFVLAEGGWKVIKTNGWKFLTRFEWLPDQGLYGIAAIMAGTIIISVIAMLVAVPVSVATALFITEYAPRSIRNVLTAFVDLLAAVPSIVYGLWGAAFLAPKVQNLAQWLHDWLGFIPFFRVSQEPPILIASSFIAGLVVSLMVIPICTSVIREVFSQTPPSEKEGALALGGNRWGMIRMVVLPFGRGGIIGGSMLGLGRAMGETIAVALVISPVYKINWFVLESGANSVASHIALKFAESSGQAKDALLAAGLALFIVTLIVNFLSSIIVSKSRSGEGVEL